MSIYAVLLPSSLAVWLLESPWGLERKSFVVPEFIGGMKKFTYAH